MEERVQGFPSQLGQAAYVAKHICGFLGVLFYIKCTIGKQLKLPIIVLGASNTYFGAVPRLWI